MELRGRLKTIAEKVPVCSIVSDVGTDHAYIPIYLVRNSICKKAVAADVKTGPLLAAKQNIEEYRLADLIETRLGDGLGPIKENECDSVVIAGMGGTLIKDILERDFSKARAAKILVLQPMNRVDELREWLYGSGFDIFDESLTCEGEKIYVIISARWTGENRKLDDIYFLIGEKLIEKKDPLLEKYLMKKIRQVHKVIEELKSGPGELETIKEKQLGLSKRLEEILRELRK